MLSEELAISAAARIEYLEHSNYPNMLALHKVDERKLLESILFWPMYCFSSLPHLEVRVEHPVGESTHANPDSLEHAVASQLVHDQGSLHLAGLLVGVRHPAMHKVGLTVVSE